MTQAPDLISYDSRLHLAFDIPYLLATDITDFWWRGTLEVKGLVKGNKWWKCYGVATRNRFCFFEGPKKKPLKCQLILSSSSILETQLVEGKKKSNWILLKEVNYEIITLKFSSPEEESLWFDQFERSRLPASVGHVSGLTTTGGSAGPSIGSNDNSDNSLERSLPEPPASLPPRAVSYSSSKSVETVIEDLSEKLEASPPALWGPYEYSNVYQVEWNFNLGDKIAPGQGMMSLHRGQLVHVTHRVNGDWWRVSDSLGHQGLIASCYLSIAYDL